MNTATLHVKVEPTFAKNLKNLARKRNMPMGELIRRAISNCYSVEVTDLPMHQKQAIEAYKGGYISLGKLAEELGMQALETRNWLNHHGIIQNNVFNEDDSANA